MSTTPPRPGPSLRQAQVVVLTLALGVMAITVVMAFLRASMKPSADVARLMPFLALGLAAPASLIYGILRRRTAQALEASREEALEQVRAGSLPQALFQLTIVGSALAEGVGLLGAVGLMLGSPWWLLAVPALSILLILLQLPTQERAENAVRNA